jgi:4-hydroxybenzoate polyprenyltransferase
MSSSTSEAPGRLAATVRIAHPFPSILDGIVTALVALIAAGDPLVAIRLGLSMTALQVSIGIVNDLIDAPRDAGRIPPKPIPAGYVRPAAARLGAVVAVVVGLGLAVPSGSPTVALALIVLAIGYGYDRFAKGTPWSWLPFAIGIPLLPVYGWLGAAGELPDFFVILVPVAMLAGAALAIANALADHERDKTAGVDSVVGRLGPGRAWWAHVALLAIVVVAALGTLVGADAALPALAGAVAGGGIVVVGVLLGRPGRPSGRQRAWEAETLGLALLAVAWVAGFTALRGPGIA